MPSETETGEERTEEPSARRLVEARSEGQIPKSVELSQVVGIVAAFIALRYVSPAVWQDLIIITKASFSSRYAVEPMQLADLQMQFYMLVRILAPEILLIMAITAFFGSLCTAMQTKFLWSTKLLKLKFSNINPLEGIKRIFSSNNLVNLIKSLAKLAIICPIAYFAFFDLFPSFLRLMDVSVYELLPFTATASAYVFKKIIILLFILGIIDYIYNFWIYKRDIKMTRKESKEERKTTEGDEATKRKIQAIGFKRIREKMMQALPTADVVVTNPTHYAVALKYDLELGGAPRVIAKGKNHMAQWIKEKAKEYGIPVIERKPLARALFAAVEIGHEIPYELYKAVAELLAYVYKLRGKNPLKNRQKSKLQTQKSAMK